MFSHVQLATQVWVLIPSYIVWGDCIHKQSSGLMGSFSSVIGFSLQYVQWGLNDGVRDGKHWHEKLFLAVQ